jgi:hypothetical protein
MGRATDCSGALHLGLQDLDLLLKANLSGLAEFHMSPARATTKAPLPRDQRKTLPVGDRMIDGASSVMFTAAFGVAKQLVPAIPKKRNLLRFILMEKPATEASAASFVKMERHTSHGAGVLHHGRARHRPDR